MCAVSQEVTTVVLYSVSGRRKCSVLVDAGGIKMIARNGNNRNVEVR